MKLFVKPSRVTGAIAVPGSKSHTIRGIAAALLADGESTLHAPLISADTLSARQAAVDLGARFRELGDGSWRFTGTAGKPVPAVPLLDLGNSGTGLRLLTAAAALGGAEVRFDGDASLRTRAMKPLLDALASLGVRTEAAPGGKCPLAVQGPLRGGKVEIDALCSQFLTALLLVAPWVEGGLEIEAVRLAEEPYVAITLEWLKRLKAPFTASADFKHCKVPGGRGYRGFEAVIPADFSTAAFPLGAGVLAGDGDGVAIRNLDFGDAQGDKAVFAMLQSLGAELDTASDGTVAVRKSSGLRSGKLDLNATPDALPLLAAVAAATEGMTLALENVPQARLKETDRIACMTQELRKMGAEVEELPDGMIVRGTRLHGAALDSHDDHRIAMALAVAALAAEGESVIGHAEACKVTYPDFITDFQKLGARFRVEED